MIINFFQKLRNHGIISPSHTRTQLCVNRQLNLQTQICLVLSKKYGV